jgi:hypothetical protein
MASTQEYAGSEKVLRINQAITSVGTFAAWTPAIAGEKVVLKGCALRARVTTTLAGVTPGEGIYLLDQALPNAILCLAVFRTATDPAGTDYGLVYGEFPGGYLLTGTSLTMRLSGGAITGGTITVTGLVWGDESL